MQTTPFIAISYHYNSDIDFVRIIAKALQTKGMGCWYLDTIIEQRRPWQDYLGGNFDWREEPQNWQATFLEHLLCARGVLVVLSHDARISFETEGRGMWREQPAVKFIKSDDSRRVLEIEKFEIKQDNSNRLQEIVEWASVAVSLPEVKRIEMTGDLAASFNSLSGVTGPLQLPERKTDHRNWCEIVRLDLYDGQWHCRQCGLRSWNYILAHENPPIKCPSCGYAGE